MTPTPDPLQEILYVSTLASDTPLRAVADIAMHSRRANQQRAITGLLVFDGLHFCHQLEGSRAEVAALMACIARDPRHSHVAILHDGPLSQRRFQHFSLGFTPVEDVEALERLHRMRGQAAVDAFLGLVPTVDAHF